MFSKKCHFFNVGLSKSASLPVGMSVRVRLPTVGYPQTPRKRDPQLGVVVVVVVCHRWPATALAVVIGERELGKSCFGVCHHHYHHLISSMVNLNHCKFGEGMRENFRGQRN